MCYRYTVYVTPIYLPMPKPEHFFGEVVGDKDIADKIFSMAVRFAEHGQVACKFVNDSLGNPVPEQYEMYGPGRH